MQNEFVDVLVSGTVQQLKKYTYNLLFNRENRTVHNFADIFMFDIFLHIVSDFVRYNRD